MIAHELGHIKHRDTLLMTITATLAGAISMLANFGDVHRRRQRDNNNGIGLDRRAAAWSSSRRSPPGSCRWPSAARANTRPTAIGAEISGRPLSLASALQKISGAAEHIPNMEAERNPASAHLFIVNPLSGARMDNLFSTHPNVENRVAQLDGDSRTRWAERGDAVARALAPRAMRGRGRPRVQRSAGLGTRIRSIRSAT